MEKLKWVKNKQSDCWELKVNDTIIIQLDKCYGVWSVWLNSLKIGDNYDLIVDAKTKGLKVAEAILEKIIL